MKKMKYAALIVLAVILCLSLVACMPSDPTKAKTNLEKDGYTVELLTDTITIGLAQAAIDKEVGADKNCKLSAQLVASKNDSHLIILWFDSAKSAKTYKEAIKAKVEKEMRGDEELGSFGKTVYYGNKDAVKAAK